MQKKVDIKYAIKIQKIQETKEIDILGILYIGHALMGAVEDTVFLHPIVKQVIGEALEELIPALKISM